MSNRVVQGLGLMALLALTLACGQVITLPTPTPVAGGTPTPEPTPTLTPTLPPTPVPVTPAPTFTPTPSPTPIVYTVQPGDTLIGIAKKFGVSVQLIQEANAIADPRALRAGQTIIVPQGVEAEEGTPTPTPTPIPFEISGVNLYRVPGGSLWCLGEVVNVSDIPIERVAVAARLYDGQGNLLAEATAFTAVDVIAPGAKGPFAVEFTDPPERFERYEVKPLSAVPAHSPSKLYNAFVVKEHSWQKQGLEVYQVQGVVVNAGDFTARDVNVVIAAYDAVGKVVALRKVSPVKDVLPPGEEAPFYVVFSPVGNPPITYTLHVQGIAVE